MNILFLTLISISFLLPAVASDIVTQKTADLAAEQDSYQIFSKTNQQLQSVKKSLQYAYQQAAALVSSHADQEEFKLLLQQITELKEKKLFLEKSWHQQVVAQSAVSGEPHALWNQEDVFLSELVAEYGSSEYVYVIPHELSAIKIHLHSNIPVPQQLWSEFLEILLRHHGLGIKEINPYARQIYLLKHDFSPVHTVGYIPEHLQTVPDGQRVCYLVSPPVEKIKPIMQFLEKFSDGKQTFIHLVGMKIAIIATKEEVFRLIDLYDKSWGSQLGKVTKILPISKLAVKEMEKILRNFFFETGDKSKSFTGKPGVEEMGLFPLEGKPHLVCIGTKEQVDAAEKIVKETESQLSNPEEMVVYLYPCLHSEASDLVKILEKVYTSLITSQLSTSTEDTVMTFSSSENSPVTEGSSSSPPLVVAPLPLHTGVSRKVEFEKTGITHFMADPKTGTILMTVRKDILDKLKDILHKLDVPKKMVQIEVLMFERKLHEQNNHGLNLLKLVKDDSMIHYNSSIAPANGVLQFFFQGKAHKHTPQFELAYNFLLTQDDIHLNACPSVVTVNQTPAIISIVEEISINNGAAPIDTNQGISYEKSFSRANYGITIKFTPTIHAPDEKGAAGCVTLKTDITFDTTKPDADDRPLVDRRHIENEVRTLDGQTIIIGGLRRKSKIDHEEKVAFFGDVPFLGKLFGTTQLIANDTEMFFFITPKIIQTPQEELLQIEQSYLKKRPGDLPELLKNIDEAFDAQKKSFFSHSLKSFVDNDR